MSNALAPLSACSSPVVNRSSTPAGGGPSAREVRRAAPRIVAIAALLSAPRIASWLFVSRPLSLTTSTGPSSGHGVHVRAQQDGGRALGARDAREQVARRPVPSSTSSPARPRQLLRERVRDRALAPRRALDLAEADEVGEQPLALLRGRGVDHAANATARSASPRASSARCRRRRRGSRRRRRARLQQAGGDRGARPGPADRGDRPVARRAPPAARGCRGRAGGPSRGCARSPTPLRSRTSSTCIASRVRLPALVELRRRSSRSTRSTGSLSSRHEVIPPAR